jgi:hypothetical protein
MLQFCQDGGEIFVRASLSGDFLDGVHHRRVVPASEAPAELGERCAS